MSVKKCKWLSEDFEKISQLNKQKLIFPKWWEYPWCLSYVGSHKNSPCASILNPPPCPPSPSPSIMTFRHKILGLPAFPVEELYSLYQNNKTTWPSDTWKEYYKSHPNFLLASYPMSTLQGEEAAMTCFYHYAQPTPLATNHHVFGH